MLQFAADVLVRAVDLALIAVALSAVYSLISFPNVALVQYAVVGAFLAIAMQAAGLPLFVAGAIACAIVAGLAVVFNMVIFERILKIGAANALIASLALGMILSAIFLVAFGSQPQRLDVPVTRAMNILGARITINQVYSIAMTMAAIGIYALVLFKTPLGRQMRATATNANLALATGIDTRKVTNIVVAISGALAALGGISLALKGSVSIEFGTNMMLPVFAAAILGGLGNSIGALVGALVIAVAETLVTNINFGPLFGEAFWFFPANYATTVSFAVLVAVLLFRPRGIFVSGVNRV
ncbi:branched-chain amino acid ABC transporter permease [Pelagibacterium halotolerans]|uniref:High-affinity branched-chain amino acid transport system permease protein LivH n=1 Tax=Pelagibacterium halotolerans (strain DSM 22347 / JCM 15775 / CGMCC 1.7692 / B2) TaxID=1082931 RepID=G4R6G0_PELHB|nr:branched-chain amino acid ABC transporter permease [Pelagibacterium halotolerans]AEQ50165.1 high-affinity branched-chain amino acid transport system permease protein LivH [Pelagibacterium halotolerans B2]QJR19827.1 branched-chain amino acid ABC transporter permease [Pelagibacterium halotolerans]SEA49496.1 amino acid/amide ABC transporter membrane protein 1, HAAT family [Pelagibacterium halotolerans]